MNSVFSISTIAIAVIASVIGVMSSRNVNQQKEPFTSDNAAWQYDSAMALYCNSTGKKPEELNDADTYAIWEHSCNLMSMFLTWAIMRGYCGEVHLKNEPDAVEKVKQREMTGTEFVIKYCDCKLWREDFSESILPFVDAYYTKYINDYCTTSVKKLQKTPLAYPFSWDDYDVYAKMIDKAYRHWKFWAKPVIGK